MPHPDYPCRLPCMLGYLMKHDGWLHADEICQQLQADKLRLGINGVYPRCWK